MTGKEVKQNKLLNLVSAETPPTFLVHAYDDDVCNVEESLLYGQKLYENGVKVEMHLFPEGGHGFGLGREGGSTLQWLDLFANWIKISN